LNAIANACGGRVRSLPADPETVNWAIREKGGDLKNMNILFKQNIFERYLEHYEQ
jgi:hypothetical protein